MEFVSVINANEAMEVILVAYERKQLAFMVARHRAHVAYLQKTSLQTN